MNTRLHKLVTGSVLAGIILGGQVFADYNKLIQTLESKGTISADEASELKIQPVMPDNKWAQKMEIRGRVHVQAAYVDGDNDVNSGDYSTFELRRARMGARIALPNNFRGHIEGNLMPDPSLRAAYIQWREHKPAYIKVGYDKPLSSLEENTSSSAILTVERSNLTNTLAAPGETVGLLVEGEMAPLFYGFGLYNDEGDVRNTEKESAEYLFNARGGVELELAEDSTLIAMVTYLQSDDPNGNVGGDYEDVTIASLHFTSGAFDIRAEYMIGSAEDSDTDGFYIQPSMMLSDKLQAVVRYEQMESDDAKGIRATSRYGRRSDAVITGVDEEGGNIVADKGDEFSALYAGLNYYLSGNGNKIMLGVEFNELSNTSAGDYETTTVFTAWRTLF
ncbi:MAG: porin [Kiritimatiellia bacterium]